MKKSELLKQAPALYQAGYKSPQVQLMLLCVIIKKPMECVLSQWLKCIDTWCDHPDYDWWYKASSWGLTIEESPESAIMLGTFEHEPGVEKRTESYIIGSLNEVLGQIDWGERTLGVFTGIAPLPHEIHLDPLSQIRNTYLSFSLKGSGRAYRARMELKRLLPRKLKPLVQKARRGNACPKWQFMDAEMKAIKGIIRKPSLQPDWYRSKTKGQLWLDSLARSEPGTFALLSKYIKPQDFWVCATGKIHPDDVHKYVATQMGLFKEA